MKVGSFALVNLGPGGGYLVQVFVHVSGILRCHGGLECFEPLGDGCMVTAGW